MGQSAGVKLPHAGHDHLCVAPLATDRAACGSCDAVPEHAGVHEHASGSCTGAAGVCGAPALVDFSVCALMEDQQGEPRNRTSCSSIKVWPKGKLPLPRPYFRTSWVHADGDTGMSSLPLQYNANADLCNVMQLLGEELLEEWVARVVQPGHRESWYR